LLEQLESMAGVSSSFPNYDAATGVLSDTATTNDFAVSVFDLSGLTSLSIDYQGGSFNGGSFVAIALLPEPSTIGLVLMALAAGLAVRRAQPGRG
jgi:hypothetical protein